MKKELLFEATNALLKAHKDYTMSCWTRIPREQAEAMTEAVINVCIKYSPTDRVLELIDS